MKKAIQQFINQIDFKKRVLNKEKLYPGNQNINKGNYTIEFFMQNYSSRRKGG